MLRKSQFIGNAGKDAEIKDAGGKSVAEFSMGVYAGKEKDGSNKTLWVKVTCWEKLADIAADRVKKGVSVYAEGDTEVECWADKKTGQPRAQIKITARSLIILEKKGAANESSEAADKEAAGF